MLHENPAHSGIGQGNETIGSSLLWKYVTGNQVWSSPAIVGDSLYIGSSDYYVYSLNATSGALLWKHATGNEVRSSPTVAGGIVYVGSMDYSVYALNASTGSLVWSHATGNVTDSSPVVAGGVVYVGSLDGKLYAFNAANGSVLWTFATGAQVVSSPAFAGGVVYVGSMDRKVYAINAANGSQIWSYTAGGSVYSSPSVVDGVVYVGSWDYSYYALNASTGALLWSFPTSGLANSCPAVVGGTVFVGSRDGSVYALSTATGSLIWKQTTGNGVSSSPAVVNGVVYVGSTDGRLYAYNATNGAQIWSYQTLGAVVSSPAISGGTVYFGSYDFGVYAIGTASSLSVLQQVWVPQPINAAEAVGVSVVAMGALSVVVSFVSNPLSAAGEGVGKKTEELVPDEVKDWFGEVVSSKRKTKVERKEAPSLRPTGTELLAYAVSVVLLAFSFAYVKISSLDQIWVLLPVFLATSILVSLVQKYLAIVFLRRRGVWSEHRIWPLGFILFLFTTLAFKVPFSSPTRSAHESNESAEKLLARAAALEVFIGLAFAGLFFLVIELGVPSIGSAGLAICMIGSLSATIPVSPMSGKDIFEYNKRRWAGLFLITLAAFCAWVFWM